MRQEEGQLDIFAHKHPIHNWKWTLDSQWIQQTFHGTDPLDADFRFRPGFIRDLRDIFSFTESAWN